MNTHDSERQAFEAWIAKDGGDLSTFGSGKHVHYSNSAVNNAWTGWLARSALSGSAESGEAWQPIATAPTDGSPVILGYMPNDDYPTGFVGQGRWVESDDDGPDNMGHDAGFVDDCYTFFHCGRSFGNPKYRGPGLQPTHWQPLPKIALSTPSALPAQAVGEKYADDIACLRAAVSHWRKVLGVDNIEAARKRVHELARPVVLEAIFADPMPQPEPQEAAEPWEDGNGVIRNGVLPDAPQEASKPESVAVSGEVSERVAKCSAILALIDNYAPEKLGTAERTHLAVAVDAVLALAGSGAKP